MKRYLLVVLVFIFGCEVKPDKTPLPMPRFTQEDIMVMYKNGWLKGKLSEQLGQSNWLQDSTEFVNFMFK